MIDRNWHRRDYSVTTIRTTAQPDGSVGLARVWQYDGHRAEVLVYLDATARGQRGDG